LLRRRRSAPQTVSGADGPCARSLDLWQRRFRRHAFRFGVPLTREHDPASRVEAHSRTDLGAPSIGALELRMRETRISCEVPHPSVDKCASSGLSALWTHPADRSNIVGRLWAWAFLIALYALVGFVIIDLDLQKFASLIYVPGRTIALSR
jgi:hypothetical protein